MPHTGAVTYAATLAAAAVKVAASLGMPGTDPVILADGANVIVHLSPAPVVAKVAASTAAVRPDPAAWLQRELDVAGFLAGRGIPVMTPSPEVPPVVHHGDGQVMSFWRYLSPSRELAGEDAIGSMLRDLHAELRDYPAQLPLLAPLADIPAFLAQPQTRLTPDQAAAVAAAYARLTAQLDQDRARPSARRRGRRQPDGHRHRLGLAQLRGHLHGARGLGPGRVHGQPAPRRPRILAAYGEPVDPAQLEVCSSSAAAPDRLVRPVRRTFAGSPPPRRRTAHPVARLSRVTPGRAVWSERA